jgi:hypothetical protein
MGKLTALNFCLLISIFTHAQKTETVYLDINDSTINMYIAVIPPVKPVKAVLFLLDGFGAAPKDVLIQTELPKYAAQQGILTIIPLLKTGALYFGVDDASQASLKNIIEQTMAKYHVTNKSFYIGGFSIGGSCAVKYAELAAANNYPVKPKAVFAVDPPLDWERFYRAAKRVVRLSADSTANQEAVYMIDRIEKEMNGSPQTASQNFYRLSPYSISDTTQAAVKTLMNTPLMLITEPDIQWWMNQRNFDLNFLNVTDHTAMINELRRMGNKKAVLITTTNKGYRKPNNIRHPHSWSIANKEQLVKWLFAQ